VPKAVQISAGRDIVDPQITAQNLQAADLTRIGAGRDLLYHSVNDSGGVDTTGFIRIGGPGRVDVLAGRDIDLALSSGIVTTGQLDNANIPSTRGADLTMMAGIAAGWDVNSFVDKIVALSPDRTKELIAYVEAHSDAQDPTLAEATAKFKDMSADLQRPLVLQQFYAELVAAGREANSDPKLGYSRGYAAIDALLPGNRTDNNPYEGDISLNYSRIYTLSGGNISLFAPGGALNVGLAEPPAGLTKTKLPGELGIVAQKAGNVSIFTDDDVLVNSSRIFTLLGGNIAIWSTRGDIDAGRGAKSSLSIPPPALLVDDQGNVSLDLSGAVAGSGIRTINTDASVKAGDVDLIAPVGFVNAGDAGIGSAGNLNIAASQVLGVDNIQVGGSAAGVPAATSGLAASLSGVSAVGGANDTATSKAVDAAESSEKSAAPIADAALSWLDVFVVGLGEENCAQTDVDCLKRQQQSPP